MWYLSVFVPETSMEAASAVAAAVWPNEPGLTLAVALVDDGGAAWQGGIAAVTDAEIAAMQALAAVPGVRFYRYAIDGDRAFGTAFPAGPEAGTPWAWTQSLLAAGLTHRPSATL